MTRNLGQATLLASVCLWVVACGGGGDAGTPDGGFDGSHPDATEFDAAFADGQVTGITTGKVCNSLLAPGGKPFDLTLEFGGSPPSRLSVRSGQCFPDIGQPCVSVPAGPGVPIIVRDGSQILLNGTLGIPTDKSVVLLGTVKFDRVTLETRLVREGVPCADDGYVITFPDAGAGDR